MTQLEQLKQFTTVVADTGDFEAMKAYKPQDATTNPSLIFKAAQQDRYRHLLEIAVGKVKNMHDLPRSKQTAAVLDELLIAFGLEILKIVPGRVSTEVDARLSYDTEGSIEKARHLIGMYEAASIDRKRILIKLASTWEGIEAARVLEAEGIHCNMTLMFSKAQAVAAAQVNATLISPFVGRILDWFKKNEGREFEAHEDPGVLSVQSIYNYYKAYGHHTEVMGASFRSKGEILELAGCDLLTISPELLQELESCTDSVARKLHPEAAHVKPKAGSKIFVDEKSFRWMMAQDPMATDKLAEGIRGFAADTLKLEKMIDEML